MSFAHSVISRSQVSCNRLNRLLKLLSLPDLNHLRYFTGHNRNQKNVLPKPVELAYNAFESTLPSSTNSLYPIIIMHGLMGSKSNFNSIAKALNKNTGRKVIVLDARNHGDSPHSSEFTYPAMAADVQYFMKKNNIPKAVHIGHSMGGRVMMFLALTKPELIASLIVEDVSPVDNNTVSALMPFLTALASLEIPSDIKTASSARQFGNKVLNSIIPNQAVREFLLMNLVEQEGKFTWRCNLEVILNNFLSQIATFPKIEDRVFPGPTLFLGGSNSDYIRKCDHEKIRELFPMAQFTDIEGAGHWVHAERPTHFLNEVVDFMSQESSDS